MMAAAVPQRHSSCWATAGWRLRLEESDLLLLLLLLLPPLLLLLPLLLL